LDASDDDEGDEYDEGADLYVMHKAHVAFGVELDCETRPAGGKPRTRFRCQHCGKLSAGRVPRSGRHVGDGTLRYPRFHKVDGAPCPGLLYEATWETETP